MKKPIFSKRCAICLQETDPIRYYIPLLWGSPEGVTCPEGVTYVSWPFGSIKIFKNRLELTCFKNINLSYNNIEYFVQKKSIFGSVIVIKHRDKKLPKYIWLASIFSSLFFKKLKSIFADNKINILFK